ncbi:MAG: hypothetical protein HW421_3753 [Ignavibacteria bacterium]|nr:hypothetical protein [Ignavibacteria bacterium]
MEGSDDRYFIKDNYQIFYLVIENELQILHIWDCRRDPDEYDLYE